MGGIRYDGGAGGSIPLTQFSDSMINTLGTLAGPAYWNVFSIVNGTAGVDIDAQLNSGALGMVFGSGSGINNNGMRASFFPASVDPNAVNAGSLTRGSFAQWTLVSRTVGIDCDVGLVLMGAPGTDQGYVLRTQSETVNQRLEVGARGTVTYTPRANCFNSAPGDIIRFEVRFSPASNEIRTYLNGVLQTVDIDNNAGRPQGGQCGFCYIGVFTGVLVMKNFSCGLL